MAQQQQFDPETAENFEEIEKQFAVKAVMHAQTYWNLLEMRRGEDLRLTKIDDDIHNHFLETFPEIDVSQKLDEDQMKSKEGKEKWRKFIHVYENKIDDFNFGTLLRTSPKDEYGENTTIFATRMQFYAVEIARNRRGLNNWIYDEEQKKKAAAEGGDATS